jgi:hypothetical protein
MRLLGLVHECNSHCGSSEHCDMVYIGEVDLHLAAPKIAQILQSDYGVKVVKVQAAPEPAVSSASSRDAESGAGGWWLTWWVENG